MPEHYESGSSTGDAVGVVVGKPDDPTLKGTPDRSIRCPTATGDTCNQRFNEFWHKHVASVFFRQLPQDVLNDGMVCNTWTPPAAWPSTATEGFAHTPDYARAAEAPKSGLAARANEGMRATKEREEQLLARLTFGQVNASVPEVRSPEGAPQQAHKTRADPGHQPGGRSPRTAAPRAPRRRPPARSRVSDDQADTSSACAAQRARS